MTWTYEQKTGKLFKPMKNGTFLECVATGYAGGNQGRNPEGKNNPDMQGVKKIGPLPCGLYTFGTPLKHSNLGPFAIPLTPDPGNEMFGRGGFYMHGDTTPSGDASEGCIILGRITRQACWDSIDHQLKVIKGN